MSYSTNNQKYDCSKIKFKIIIPNNDLIDKLYVSTKDKNMWCSLFSNFALCDFQKGRRRGLENTRTYLIHMEILKSQNS
jgi:hypothetical protein